jgi:hypothetical protein
VRPSELVVEAEVRLAERDRVERGDAHT